MPNFRGLQDITPPGDLQERSEVSAPRVGHVEQNQVQCCHEPANSLRATLHEVPGLPPEFREVSGGYVGTRLPTRPSPTQDLGLWAVLAAPLRPSRTFPRLREGFPAGG